MKASIKGPWREQEIEAFLRDSRFPLRLGCNASDGFPRVVSLWYQYHAPQLFCVTHRDSKLIVLLRRDPQVGFEISPNEPPYFGVRGQARATLQDLESEATLQQLLERYLGGVNSSLGKWLLGRSTEEILISLSPLRLYSWDYRERMSGAVTGAAQISSK